MLWRFSFASSSNVDTLLTRDQPPELEEVLDDQDILSELKAQNNRLVTYLSKEDHIKSLLQWVVAGLDELDQAAEKSNTASFQHAISSPHLFPSIQLTPISSAPAPGPGSPPLEPAKMADEGSDGKDGVDQSPYSPELPAALGQGLGNKEGDDETKRARYPLVATEILTSELWSISETIMTHKDNLLRPFWDAVLSTIESDPPTTEKEMSQSRHEQSERDRAVAEFWSDEDEERHRKRETIRGLWTRVNGSLLQKRPQEMVWFIQTIPNVVERLVTRIESPAIQDLFVRLISAEHNGVFGVIDWLANEGLITRLIKFLSPEYPPSMHVIAADLLKGIVSVCAPVPFDPTGGNAEEQAGQGGGAGSKNNRLIREMVSDESVSNMIGYMLDDVGLSDRNWKGLNGEDVDPSPADPFVVHPLPSISSASSSLSQICMLLVELVRRNNSDFSEPHLFHTLRNRLMTIRTQQLQTQSESGGEGATGGGAAEGDERAAMEEAMEEISPKMGIVHLGGLLTKVIERFGDLHHFLLEPRSQIRAASSLHPKPLTTERFRIVELYAELLHSSNMSIFNRTPGSGPTYTSAGVLSGGLDSLEALGNAIDGVTGGEEDPTPEAQVTQARELPVSAGSTEPSISGSSDIASDDEAVLDAADEATPSQSPAASRTLDRSEPAAEDAHPPPPSQADVARLRDLRDQDSAPTGSAPTSDMASVSHAAVAASTIAPSVTSEHPTEGRTAPDPPRIDTDDTDMSLGDRLKSKYLQYRVIPTIVDLFFDYPHNDFAHHVIYDLLQQILNGRLGPGLNRELVIEMIKESRLAERILDAQRANDRLALQPRKPRLPYMGHIILIAEELVKFFARCPPDLWAVVEDSFVHSEWHAFVDGSLRETRDRDARPLAGGKPMQAGPSSDVAGPKSDDSSDDDDEAALSAHKFGEPLTRTMAQDGYSRGGGDNYESYEDRHESGDDDDTYWRGMSESRRHVDSSDDDDDDDAEWLRPSVRNAARGGDIGSDDDDFAGFQSGSSRVQHLDDFDDDDAWGNFSNTNNTAGPSQPAAGADNANPFEDFRPDPLTPHDWASEFDREFSSDNWAQGAGDGDGNEEDETATRDAPSIVMPAEDDDDEGAEADAETFSPRPGSTWSFTGVDEGEDLPPTLSPTLDDTPKLGGEIEKKGDVTPPTQGMSGLSLTAPRDASGQVRRNPPPPPPSRSTKPSASATSASTVLPTVSPQAIEAVSSSDQPSTPPALHPVSSNSGTDPIPDRMPAQPAGIDIPSTTNTSSPQRSASLLDAQALSPPEASLIHATSPDAPLGPGVSKDATVTEQGLVQREVDGEVITVPADEIVRGVEDAIERQSESSEGGAGGRSVGNGSNAAST